MPATNTRSKKLRLPEFFPGADGRIVNSQNIKINNFIELEWHEVSMYHMPEEKGMLHLYPIDDGKFYMQLYFLQSNNDNSSEIYSLYSLKFLPSFFDQYPPDVLLVNQPFRFDQTTEQPFPVCAKTTALLARFHEGEKLTPFTRALSLNETAIQLLRCTLECITLPFTVCQVPACRFLAFESEREKIMDARHLLDQHADHPYTIRELSRKVGINECYLKKGFKALTGKTVHDYQQTARINKAKELLQQGISVTHVAITLGFSSISHFSTAFKRNTGLKPCELLK